MYCHIFNIKNQTFWGNGPVTAPPPKVSGLPRRVQSCYAKAELLVDLVLIAVAAPAGGRRQRAGARPGAPWLPGVGGVTNEHGAGQHGARDRHVTPGSAGPARHVRAGRAELSGQARVWRRTDRPSVKFNATRLQVQRRQTNKGRQTSRAGEMLGVNIYIKSNRCLFLFSSVMGVEDGGRSKGDTPRKLSLFYLFIY